MAVTIAKNHYSALPGGAAVGSFTVTYDNSYPTSGEVLDLSSYFGGSPDVYATGDDGWTPVHNRGTAAAGKLLLYGSADANAAANQEMANATDASAVICKVLAVGSAASS